MGVVHTAVTTEPIELAAHHALVEHASAGAVASFVGMIRDHDPEASGTVTGIEYTWHPDAAERLADLTVGVLAGLAGGNDVRVAVSHRVGHLDVGEVALVCCAAAPHRAEAFAACAAVVEAIKAELPIWKRQLEADGRAVWSGLGLEPGP